MTEIESILRAFLIDETASLDISPAAAGWLDSSRSAVRPKRRHLAAAIGVVVTGCVGAAAADLALGSTGAYAAWSARPTTASTGQIANADSQCTDMLTGLANRFARSAHPGIAAGSAEISGAWTVILNDIRGPYTLVEMSNSSSTHAACLAGIPNGPGLVWIHPGSTLSSSLDGIGPAERSWNDQTDATVMIGEVGSAVTSVTLTLSNGTSVAATVHDGQFAAWWPGRVAPSRSVQVRTAAGTIAEQL